MMGPLGAIDTFARKKAGPGWPTNLTAPAALGYCPAA